MVKTSTMIDFLFCLEQWLDLIIQFQNNDKKAQQIFDSFKAIGK